MDTAFTITALIGGTVLGFQFVMMLMGLGDDGGGAVGGEHAVGLGDADGGHAFGDGHMAAGVDGDVLSGDTTGSDHSWKDVLNMDHVGTHWFYEVLSLRTLSAALTFFGLTGKTMRAYGHPPWASFLWAVLAGVAAMYFVYWLFQQIFKLQHAGNENIRNAIGLPATVYVPIPGSHKGPGKVTFRLQNRIVEYQAVTEDETKLPTGEDVVIVGIVSPDTVRVARPSQLAKV
jgi:hypothetical protein